MPLYASFAVIFKGRFRSRRNKMAKLSYMNKDVRLKLKTILRKKQ